MRTKVGQISQKLKLVVMQYPMVLAMALIAAVTTVYSIENEISPDENFLPMRIILTAALGISVMFAVKMRAQRSGKEALLTLAGLLVLACFFYVLPQDGKDFTEVYAFLLIPSFLMSHLAVACIAFIGREPETNFWQYNKNLFINFFLTAVFTMVLTAGVLLAILAVDQLFTLNINGRLYFEVHAVLSILGSVLIFLLFNNGGLHVLEQGSDYPVVLKFFTQFVLIPLLMIYVVILYFYLFKIIISGELPEGWVSYLVLAYSLVGILALLLVHPLANDQAKSWVKVFSRVFYYSLLPLIGLLFVAIYTRLLQYGYTEARYYVLLLAIWLLLVVLYFIFAKRATIRFIPLSMFALTLMSLITPYINCFSVAERSQKHELEQLLEKEKLLVNGKINFEKSVDYEVAGNVSDKFKFLSERGQQPYLKQYLSDTQIRSFSVHGAWTIRGFFKEVADPKQNYFERLTIYNRNHMASLDGYEHLMMFSGEFQTKAVINGDTFTFQPDPSDDGDNLSLTVNGERKLLRPMLLKIIKDQPAVEGMVYVDNLSVDFKVDKYEIRLLLNNIGVHRFNKVESMDLTSGVFLIRRAK